MVSEKVFYSIVAVLVILGGIGVGAVYYHEVSTANMIVPNTHDKVYNLTLVETMNNNMQGQMQPRFFELTHDGLVPTANISLPSHTLVVLTIISYDTPTPGTPAQYSNVTGTVGDQLTLINGTTATGGMSNTSNGSMMGWEMNVTSIPASQIAHTITISGLGINVPVEGGFTEIAYLYFNTTGTFTWQCMSPCGLGSSGWEGAMSTPGWMTGTVYVY